MNFDTVLIALAVWLLGSVPVSLALAGRMRGVAAREARTHRGHRRVRARRVSRPLRELSAAGETSSMAQLRTRLAFSELPDTGVAARAPRVHRRGRRGDLRTTA